MSSESSVLSVLLKTQDSGLRTHNSPNSQILSRDLMQDRLNAAEEFPPAATDLNAQGSWRSKRHAVAGSHKFHNSFRIHTRGLMELDLNALCSPVNTGH